MCLNIITNISVILFQKFNLLNWKKEYQQKEKNTGCIANYVNISTI